MIPKSLVMTMMRQGDILGVLDSEIKLPAIVVLLMALLGFKEVIIQFVSV